MEATDVAVNITRAMSQNQHGGWDYFGPRGDLESRPASVVLVSDSGEKFRITVEKVA